MKQSPLVVANEKRHVLALIRKHGLTGARRQLEAEGKKPLSLVTLANRAKEAKIQVPGRGRPAVYDEKTKARIIDLIRQHGSYKVVKEVLAKENQACPTPPMLGAWCKEAGVVVRRGRPPVAPVAA